MVSRKSDWNRYAALARRGFVSAVLVLALLFTLPQPTPAEEAGANPLAGVSLSTLAYFDYSAGQSPRPGDAEADYNDFRLTRGYLTFKKQANPWLSARVTLDITQDSSGDYKRREKYLYAELQPRDLGFFTNMKAEIGLGHMPWLDFEEHINPYRCQGTMAAERAGVFNSADLGASLRGCLGGKLENAKAKTGNKNYDGRYGSWHVGLYNGGGYHAAEINENKTFEGRLTIRPLADALPGLQFSYLGVFGKGNTVEAPDYIVNLGMLTYEYPGLTFTAQAFTTEGNAKGSWVIAGKAVQTLGYSTFANVQIPGTEGRWSLFGRYDHFDADKDDIIADKTAYDMVLGGVSYDIYQGNLIMLVFETTDYQANSQGKGQLPTAVFDEDGDPLGHLGQDQKIQLVYQINL
jgi:hypothetical protein